jgi:predicted RNase H-like HicB family nuclease
VRRTGEQEEQAMATKQRQKKGAPRTFTVTYERDEDGWWVAAIDELQGVHTQSRTIAEARRRIREPLALALDDETAEEAQLIDEVKPAEARTVLNRARGARESAEKAQVAALAESETAAQYLTKRLGLSLRDIGDLLGLSRQRVQQLKRRSHA